MTPAPVPYHQRIIIKLGRILDEFVTKNNLGIIFVAPCDVLLSEEDVIQPDLFFISNEKMSIITDKYIAGVPDLAIEILSTYTKKLDKLLKKKLYESYGVKEYWVVDIDKKTIEIFSLKGKSYKTIGIYKEKDIVESDLIKGLTFSVKEIF
jgi:Uma2 family endonuclease